MLATVEAKKPPSSPHFRGDQADPTAGVKLSASTCTMLWEKYGTSCETSVPGTAALNPPAAARTRASIIVALPVACVVEHPKTEHRSRSGRGSG